MRAQTQLRNERSQVCELYGIGSSALDRNRNAIDRTISAWFSRNYKHYQKLQNTKLKTSKNKQKHKNKNNIEIAKNKN